MIICINHSMNIVESFITFTTQHSLLRWKPRIILGEFLLVPSKKSADFSKCGMDAEILDVKDVFESLVVLRLEEVIEIVVDFALERKEG